MRGSPHFAAQSVECDSDILCQCIVVRQLLLVIRSRWINLSKHWNYVVEFEPSTWSGRNSWSEFLYISFIYWIYIEIYLRKLKKNCEGIFVTVFVSIHHFIIIDNRIISKWILVFVWFPLTITDRNEIRLKSVCDQISYISSFSYGAMQCFVFR